MASRFEKIAMELIVKYCANSTSNVFPGGSSRHVELAAGKYWPHCQYTSD